MKISSPRHFWRTIFLAATLVVFATSSQAQTSSPAPQLAGENSLDSEFSPEQWAELGKVVHGGFGSYIALGIRIGLDARERLGAKRRETVFVFAAGPNAPCACVADGLIVALSASPGQKTATVSPRHSGPNTFGSALISHKDGKQSLRYTLPASSRALLDEINALPSGAARFEAVMKIPEEKLWRVTRQTTPKNIPQP